MNKRINIQDLGMIPYAEARDLQEAIVKDIVSVKIANRNLDSSEQEITSNQLLICEHPHVYTLGKSGALENLLLNNEELIKRGISFFKTNRGGDITYHGPGQVVGYPLLDLENYFTDLGRYLRSLEEVIIRVISNYGIKGDRLPGATGVWLDPKNPFKARKICAMGIRCTRWVTMHGFALNVNTDLSFFQGIIPCGITDKNVTSIQAEVGQMIDMEEVKMYLYKEFQNVFKAEMQLNLDN